MAVSEEIQKQMLEEAVSVTPNFETDYTDERFDKIDQDYQKDSIELDQTYGGIINATDGYYKDLSEEMENRADKMAQIQQENTDFAIEKIEQEKDKAQKDYIKEQSGAYVDWQKQSNKYGVEAEKMASAGLTGTGYSESSQVAMYNQYQNRVATARETLSNIILNYNNNIKEAQLQNNAALAQIYADLSVQQMELALQGFQYKNQLVLELANKKQTLKDNKWQKELAIIQQQNHEKEMAWDAAKYYDTQKWQEKQNEIEREFQLKRDEINNEFEAKQAELNRKHDYDLLNAKTEKERQLAKEEHEREMAKLAKEQEYALTRMDEELANAKELAKYENSLNSVTVGGSGSSGSSYSSKSYTQKLTNDEKKINPAPAVSTAYYKGGLNSDAKKYGTFSNGYQPKGISGHGTLSKTGKTIQIKTQTLSGQKQTVVQNVWKAEDGTKWYWEGRQNKYIQIK